MAFQRQLPWNLVGEVAYVGNVGRGIVLPDWNINAGMTLGADNAGRPYYQLYGRTANVRSWLATNTNYNALQAKLDRRFRNGFLLTTSYTLSRAINYPEETGIATPADIERSKGRADFDRTHAFAAASSGTRRSSRRARAPSHWVLGGWQISGIFTAYSGTADQLHGGRRHAARPGQHAAAEPQRRRPRGVRGHRARAALLRHGGLLGARAEHLGNMTRNDSINGPGFWNVDLRS